MIRTAGVGAYGVLRLILFQSPRSGGVIRTPENRCGGKRYVFVSVASERRGDSDAQGAAPSTVAEEVSVASERRGDSDLWRQ